MNVKTTRTLGKLITLSLITSTMIHATNGDNLISVGAKARGMGGVGIAMAHGAESGLSNGALITSVESSEIGFGGTLFMPDIETQINGFGDPAYTSDADMNVIPEVSLAHKIDENWYIGVGMWGTGGMGTDYSKASGGAFNNFNMVTNLQLMQFAVPIAYKTGGLSLSVTPVLQYGNLDINYIIGPNPLNIPAGSVGAGLAQDFGFGYNVGLAYDLSSNGISGLTFGAMYKSAIEMDYDGQLTTASAPFGLTLPNGDTLEQPEEYGVGLAYAMGQHTIAFDYKKIKWSDAKGYSDYGWEDSNVYAVGYQYTENEWTIRLGYNHASSAVVEVADPRLNFFNLLGFPATAEDHYTVGASYEFTHAFSLDLAYVYQDNNNETFDVSTLFGPGATVSTDHAEDSVSFQLAYKF
ncbi:outer membrane protein transport protein [Sulfurovum sp. XGS-02]|uniref:OmpP1/FadL family transporter n=1 Tax=Sulfurovum sp. XGS-02 TaxID=2925411 RepID=UPI00206536AC|nr:porin [Sulfurovum sp. XGS-02]UPT76772.1 outer membrane protein transport protein [Sulfurovum sp. XGS-02]